MTITINRTVYAIYSIEKKHFTKYITNSQYERFGMAESDFDEDNLL